MSNLNVSTVLWKRYCKFYFVLWTTVGWVAKRMATQPTMLIFKPDKFHPPYLLDV